MPKAKPGDLFYLFFSLFSWEIKYSSFFWIFRTLSGEE